MGKLGAALIWIRPPGVSLTRRHGRGGVELAVHQEREQHLPAHGVNGSVALGRFEEWLAPGRRVVH